MAEEKEKYKPTRIDTQKPQGVSSHDREKTNKCLDIVRETHNPELATKLVYNKSVESALAGRPGLHDEIIKIMDEAGLKKEYLAGKLKTVIDETTDDSAKLRGIEMGFKLHRSFMPENVNINQVLTIEAWRDLDVGGIKREIVDAVETLQRKGGS